MRRILRFWQVNQSSGDLKRKFSFRFKRTSYVLIDYVDELVAIVEYLYLEINSVYSMLTIIL